jgi:hypothetical protein
MVASAADRHRRRRAGNHRRPRRELYSGVGPRRVRRRSTCVLFEECQCFLVERGHVLVQRRV